MPISLELSSRVEKDTLLQALVKTEPTLWLNPDLKPIEESLSSRCLHQVDSDDAAARLQRFAPFIVQQFPETAAAGGLIESPLRFAPKLKDVLERYYDQTLPGNLLLKCDSHLPISGSIKARGGIYEVLKYAESVALDAGLLNKKQCYSRLADPELRALFSRYSIVVGSTGNLGLSIGIMGAALGFRVTVHMSADARAWKKKLLREKGVEVVEYADDYSRAVEEGRKQALSQTKTHFVDDENSTDLFLGYSVAGHRLREQFDSQGIVVNEQNPLFVYLPCGVGGGPGGVAFGLKQQFGDNVHCFFAEPTHSPCMLLGMHTKLHDQITVQDIGIDNLTCADGLAVGRASAFIGQFMAPLLSGIYTVADEELLRLLVLLEQSEGITLEPSALAGVSGISYLSRPDNAYLQQHGLVDKMSKASHLIWATGGSMVPDTELNAYLDKGRSLFF